MDSLMTANNNFSLELFKKINENKKTGNIFYSPLSISSALAMVFMGARGDTAAQMSKVLGFDKEKKPEENPGQQQQAKRTKCPQTLKSAFFHKPDDDVHSGFKKLMSQLNREGAAYSLSLANRLFGEQTFEFETKYIQDTGEFYQAELETVDFKSKAEDARVKINGWVEKQTQDKIKELLQEGIVDDMTKLVLVNAIYFKADWAKKFKGSDTNEQDFKLNKNESKPVQMMHQTAMFSLAFIEEVNCQILEMPYIGKELSMLIILPKEIDDDSTGLQKLERELTNEKLIEWTQPEKMDRIRLRLALPKFKMEETYNMKEILVSMGMEDAFGSKSDFTGMSANNDLVLSQVVHKSFVEVDEEGTEAAAATAAIMMLGCAMPPPDSFTADHPFLFFIRHNPTQSILFYGRFCSP